MLKIAIGLVTQIAVVVWVGVALNWYAAIAVLVLPVTCIYLAIKLSPGAKQFGDEVMEQTLHGRNS